MLAPGTATRLMQSTDSSTGVVSGLGGGVSGASGLLSKSAFTWARSTRQVVELPGGRCEKVVIVHLLTGIAVQTAERPRLIMYGHVRCTEYHRELRGHLLSDHVG